MVYFVNVADLKDPNDLQGRTYRQVNNAKAHKYELGVLVEIDNGARLFIAMHTRDCDGTPLYSLTPNNEQQYLNKELERLQWVHGYSEDGMKAI